MSGSAWRSTQHAASGMIVPTDSSAWDVFGDVTGEEPSTASLVQQLGVTRAGDPTEALAPFCNADGTPISVGAPPEAPDATSFHAHRDALAVWPDFPPQALGALALASSLDEVGGGRGFIAARDVVPGQVLIVEAPVLPWSSSERGPVPLLSALLRSPKRDILLQAVSRLHPESLCCVPLAELSRLEKEHASAIDELLPLWEAVLTDSNGERRSSGSTAREALLRLCLAVRWNAFEGGLFLHQAIFNHAPARLANCDKVTTLVATPGDEGDASAGQRLLSIVRATRHVPTGRELLISYYSPPELSADAAAEHLSQFDFVEHCPHDPLLDAPPVCCGADGRVAPTAVQLENAAVRRVRQAAHGPSLTRVVLECREILDEIAAACGTRHLAVAHLRREVSAILRRQLEAAVVDATALPDATLLLLESAMELWSTQRTLLGPLHPECAQTLHDVASALGSLLCHAPQALFRAFPCWSTPALASHGERRARELHEQIAALYSQPMPEAYNRLAVGTDWPK